MAEAHIDLNALTTLRPGMPVTELQMIFGNDWVPLQPGRSFFFAENIGFVARIDVRGIIGIVMFASTFPRSLTVENLHVGMSLAAARAAHPTLRQVEDPDAARSKADRHATRLRDGTEVAVRVRDGRVLAIHLTRPGLTYEPPPPAYPPAEPTPGAPFADPNLKLVVLNALLNQKVIDLGLQQHLAKQFLGGGYDREKDGYQLLKPVYDYLVRYPLTDAQLAAVESLTFDGGNDIYPYAFPFWDGESEDFCIKSLAGIERLVNLRGFHVISMLRDNDLGRLKALPKLEAVTLDPGPFRNAEVLPELPSLKKFEGYDGSLAPSIEKALAAKGVKMTIFR